MQVPLTPPANKLKPGGSNSLCRSLRNSPHIAEGIDEVRIDRHQFGFRMFFAHHLEHGLFSMLPDVDQYQVLAGYQVVVKLGELLMLAVDSHEPPSPGANQCARSDKERKNKRGTRIPPEGFRIKKHPDARQSGHTSERGADEAVAHDIQGFEVITGVDLMPLEARVVAANDV